MIVESTRWITNGANLIFMVSRDGYVCGYVYCTLVSESIALFGLNVTCTKVTTKSVYQ